MEGAGGLAVARILAKLSQNRMRLLEKHCQLGGLAHEFSRGRFAKQYRLQRREQQW